MSKEPTKVTKRKKSANPRPKRPSELGQPVKRLVPKIPKMPTSRPTGLTVKERRALGALAAGKSVPDAAKEAGLTPGSLKNKLARGALRQKFIDILQDAGLTDTFIANKFKVLADASTVKWNKATEQWDEFTDNTTQLNTMKTVTEIMGYFPEKGERAAVAVQIISPLATALTTMEQDLARGEVTIEVETEGKIVEEE